MAEVTAGNKSRMELIWAGKEKQKDFANGGLQPFGWEEANYEVELHVFQAR